MRTSGVERISNYTLRPVSTLHAQQQQVDIPPLRGMQAIFREVLNDGLGRGQAVSPGADRAGSKVFLHDAMTEREIAWSGFNQQSGPDNRVPEQVACVASGPVSIDRPQRLQCRRQLIFQRGRFDGRGAVVLELSRVYPIGDCLQSLPDLAMIKITWPLGRFDATLSIPFREHHIHGGVVERMSLAWQPVDGATFHDDTDDYRQQQWRLGKSGEPGIRHDSLGQFFAIEIIGCGSPMDGS